MQEYTSWRNFERLLSFQWRRAIYSLAIAQNQLFVSGHFDGTIKVGSLLTGQKGTLKMGSLCSYRLSNAKNCKW